MKTLIKHILVLIMIIVSMSSSCNDKNYGKPMRINNNSDQTIYYWFAHWIYDKNHTNYHYPDTILPAKQPILRQIEQHSAVSGVERMSLIPNWEKIFSDLPASKFSVYFFTERPETQEAWDLVREHYNLYRKDVTYQEFIDNDYIIDYQ